MTNSQTRTIRIQLMCSKGVLKYTRSIPSNLTTTDTTYAKTPEYVLQILDVMQPIVQEYQEVARQASDEKCMVCGMPASMVTMTPISHLHFVGDPLINVYIHPVCGKKGCDMRTMQTRQELSAVNASIDQDQPPKASPKGPDLSGAMNSLQIMTCNVCQQVAGCKNCSRCGVVAYCGKGHQTLDWPSHKKNCKKQSQV